MPVKKKVGRPVTPRKIIPVAFNLKKHADLLAFMSELCELRNISENKAIREIMYYGKDEIQQRIKDKRYFITPEHRA